MPRLFMFLKLRLTGRCWTVKRFKVAGAPGFTVYMRSTRMVMGAGLRKADAEALCRKLNARLFFCEGSS